MKTGKRRVWLVEVLQTLLLAGAVMWVLDWWRAPVIPQALPPLALADGGAADVAALSREAPVVLYFWGSWCGICRHTSPALDRLHADGVKVVGVAVSSGDAAAAAGYLKRQGWQFATAADEDGRLAAAWQVKAFPTVAVVRDGKIRHSTSGISSYYGLKARLALAAW